MTDNVKADAAVKVKTKASDGTQGDTTAAVATYNRDKNRAEFFGFQRGNTVFSFDESGHAISRKLLWPAEPVSVPVRRNQFSLPIIVDGMKEFPALPPGLIVVSGDTGAGKSTFIKALARQMPLARLLAVEPHDTGEELAILPTFSSVDGALVAAVNASYNDPSTLFSIDSLRAPLFETEGAAGARGVIMPFFTQLTRVSNSLALAGISIVATVNPMNDDKDYVVEFMKKLSAAVPATILLNGMTRSSGLDRFTGTLSMRPNRAPMPFSFESGVRSVIDHGDLINEIEFDPISAADFLNGHSNLLINALNKAV
jgi:energy-coupling factor transporter ATP-binding protein EcfA2